MFHLTGQFVPSNFAKLQKQSLAFIVILIGTYMPVIKKEMLYLNLRKLLWIYKWFWIHLKT